MQHMPAACLFLALTMMPAQLALVASAALPPLPTTRDFLERLAEVNRPKTDEGRAELCLAPALQQVEVAKLPNGTICSRKQAYRAALDFQKVVEIKHREHELQNLDDWFTAFAVFTLAVETLTDDKALPMSNCCSTKRCGRHHLRARGRTSSSWVSRPDKGRTPSST